MEVRGWGGALGSSVRGAQLTKAWALQVSGLVRSSPRFGLQANYLPISVALVSLSVKVK